MKDHLDLGSLIDDLRTAAAMLEDISEDFESRMDFTKLASLVSQLETETDVLSDRAQEIADSEDETED